MKVRPLSDQKLYNKVHVRRGAAQEDLIRDAPPMYADGIVMAAGANRPSPRKISNELFQQVRLKVVYYVER